MSQPNGPDGTCLSGCRQVNFGALPMPPGYSVWWHEEVEQYVGHGPDETESDVCGDRFACRRWCIRKSGGQS